MFEFSILEYDTKLLCAQFGSPWAGGCSGIRDTSFVAHITINPVYFQYTRSRPQESYKVVSLPSIQLTPNNLSPTGGRCSLDLLYLKFEIHIDFSEFVCIFGGCRGECIMFWIR